MKILRMLLWILICASLLLGLMYLFTGSLEWFPTPDQREKAKIVSLILIIVPIVSGIILFLTSRKSK